MAFVAARVAPYKKVRRLEFVEQIPKSPSGKILRRVLVERERADALESGVRGQPRWSPQSSLAEHGLDRPTTRAASALAEVERLFRAQSVRCGSIPVRRSPSTATAGSSST